MPATYAHYRFGQDVLKALPERYRDVLLKYEDLFSIGLHGPDLLFYHRPFTSRHPLHIEGGRMHRMTGREFFTEAGKTFLAGGSRKADYVYLCGFLCHFALDRACHGYINRLAEEGAVSHAEIESELDRVLLEEDGIDPIRTNLAAHIHASRRAAGVIAPYFPGTSMEKVLSGIRGLWFFNVLLTIPGRVGYRQVDRLLAHMPKYDKIRGHMINKDPNPLCEQSNADLRRLYEGAVKDACLLIRSFLPAVRGHKEWPDIMEYDFESARSQPGPVIAS